MRCSPFSRISTPGGEHKLGLEARNECRSIMVIVMAMGEVMADWQ